MKICITICNYSDNYAKCNPTDGVSLIFPAESRNSIFHVKTSRPPNNRSQLSRWWNFLHLRKRAAKLLHIVELNGRREIKARISFIACLDNIRHRIECWIHWQFTFSFSSEHSQRRINLSVTCSAWTSEEGLPQWRMKAKTLFHSYSEYLEREGTTIVMGSFAAVEKVR